jgi:hypothetical protein
MAHPDLQALVDSLLPFVQSLLREQGEFHPLGAILHSDGAIQSIAADSGEDFPDAQTLIDMMRGLIKDKAAALEIRSTVICYDCLTLPPGDTVKTDAIGFDLERYSGESISLFVPYVKRDKGLQFGAIFEISKTTQFFPASSRPQ